jgi:hypothetical protein
MSSIHLDLSIGQHPLQHSLHRVRVVNSDTLDALQAGGGTRVRFCWGRGMEASMLPNPPPTQLTQLGSLNSQTKVSCCASWKVSCMPQGRNSCFTYITTWMKPATDNHTARVNPPAHVACAGVGPGPSAESQCHASWC